MPGLIHTKAQASKGWSDWSLALKLWVTFTTLVLSLSLILFLIVSPPKALLYLMAVIPVGLLLLAFYLLDYRHTLPSVIAFESFWLGAAVSAPVAVGLEIFFIWLTPIASPGTPGAPPLALHVFYSLLRCFLCIALVEELCKLIFIVRIRPATPENPAETDEDISPDALSTERFISHPYGVVVASICTAAGFAAVENITYVVFAKRLMLGVETAILRAFVSVPGHMAFSALAASFIAEYKFHPQLAAKGSVRAEPHPGWLLTFFGLGAATMIHGVFDWVLSCVEILKKHKIASATFLTVLSGMITLALIGLTLLLFVLLSRPLRLYSEMPYLKSYRINTFDETTDLKPAFKIPSLGSRRNSAETGEVLTISRTNSIEKVSNGAIDPQAPLLGARRDSDVIFARSLDLPRDGPTVVVSTTEPVSGDASVMSSPSRSLGTQEIKQDAIVLHMDSDADIDVEEVEELDEAALIAKALSPRNSSAAGSSSTSTEASASSSSGSTSKSSTAAPATNNNKGKGKGKRK